MKIREKTHRAAGKVPLPDLMTGIGKRRNLKGITERGCAFSRLARIGVSCFALCALMIMMNGCSTGNMKQYIRPGTDIGSIKTIAVLPFHNYTTEKYAGENIRNKVSIELLSRGFDIIEPGEIDMTLNELKIRSLDSLRSEDIQNIGSMVQADAVITGSVEEFGMSTGITVSYPEVSVYLMMFDTPSGKVIWSLWHTTGGASFWTRHFGAEGNTLYNAAARVIREAFDKLF